MKKLDFHIDQPIIHDSSIEARKDFSALMSKFQAQASTGTTYLSIWIVSSFLAVGLIGVLSFWNAALVSPQETIQITESSAQPERESPAPEHVVITLSEAEETFEPQEPQTQELPVMVMSVHESPVTRIKSNVRDIEPMHIPSLEEVPMESPDLIQRENYRLPSDLPIEVDIVTYTELRLTDSYYFEIDQDSQEHAEKLMTTDWDEAVLRRHSDKNKYRLILRHGKERLEIIVRLVKNQNTDSETSKFRFRNLFH